MNSIEYVANAIRTESVLPVDKRYSLEALKATLALATNAGHIVDQVKKNLYYYDPAKPEKSAIKIEALADQVSALLTNAQRLHLLLQDLGQVETSTITDDPAFLRILHAGLGIFTEGGEILEAVEKALHGSPLDLVNVGEEGGDVDWYKAILQDATGTHEEDIRARNIAKLRVRYPNRFEAHQAIDRDLVSERAILEGKLPPATT